MATRNVVVIWIINCIFLLINFYLWAYSPSLSQSSENSSDHIEGLAAGFSEEENLIEKHAVLHRLSPRGNSDSSMVDSLQDANINDVISKGWRESESGKEFLQLKKHPTDVYQTVSHVNLSSMTYDISDYAVPKIKYTDLVNCAAILEGSTEELEKAQAVMMKTPKEPIYEETYLEWTQNCPKFIKDRGYVQVPLSKEEEQFPLAFSIAMYTDIEQTERLLRAIYQPQNLYCIHIDTKSPLLLHRTVQFLVSCFPNVFIASHLDKIKWGDVSVLLPAINCMRDFVRHYRGKWKYFINLTGQEVPLRTNWELVQIAKIFNGSNDIGGSAPR